jgi:hypothetical protein
MEKLEYVMYIKDKLFGRAGRRLLSSFFLMFGLILGGAPAFAGSSDNLGTDFWLAFPKNYASEPALTLFISGDNAASGNVSVPGIGFTADFTVTPGVVTSVVVPANAQIDSEDGIENKGIHVTSSAEVAVYGLNRIQYTTDAYLGLPKDVLGTEYRVLAYTSNGLPSQLTVVASENATTVTINPTTDAGSHPAGVPFDVTLQQGEVYQLGGAVDVTGSSVIADKPVAVYGGNNCANIPPGYGYCDYLVEQMPPLTAWGKSFVTVPLAARSKGDTFRILANEDNTAVTINGAVVATLNKGQFHEQIIEVSSVITSSAPVLVAQYANGSQYDEALGDPFEMLIPPFEQFLTKYTVSTPADGFEINYANLVVSNAEVGNVKMDGVAIPAASYSPIGSSGFSGAQVAITQGGHTFSGTLPFGVFVYGFNDDDSYGYPGGSSYSPIAVVSKVNLTPKTGTSLINKAYCLVATILDQKDQPLKDIRVDFMATGVNSAVGSVQTNVSGAADFCYSGANVGTDTVTAMVGTLFDMATVTWTKGNSLSPIVNDKTPPPPGPGFPPVSKPIFGKKK